MPSRASENQSVPVERQDLLGPSELERLENTPSADHGKRPFEPGLVLRHHGASLTASDWIVAGAVRGVQPKVPVPPAACRGTAAPGFGVPAAEAPAPPTTQGPTHLGERETNPADQCDRGCPDSEIPQRDGPLVAPGFEFAGEQREEE